MSRPTNYFTHKSRIDLDRILQHPTRPVESSSNPLCEFLVNLFSDMPEELLQHIADLEECQRARFIAQPLQLRVAENSDQMILVTPTAKS